MHRSTLALVVGLVAVACDASDGESVRARDSGLNDTLVIDGRSPSCVTCALDTAFLTTIGSRSDGEVPQRVPTVLRDSRGMHYLFFNGWGNKPILRYDSAGRYLGIVGRYGQGPGEYQMTFSVFVGPGDSLFVFAEGRLQVFAPNGEYAGTIRVPRPTPFAVADSGWIYSGGRSRGGGSVESETFVVVSDRDGVVRDSFPTFSAPRFTDSRPVATPRGEVWTYLGGYRLERHAQDGRVEQLLGVITSPDGRRPLMTRADFDSVGAAIRASGPPRRMPVNERPQPRPSRRMEVLVDSAGLLWIARTIPAPAWDTMTIGVRYNSPDEAPNEATIDREHEDRMHHTIVEVIDPHRAALLARTELPFLGMLARPGYVARVTADDDGMFRTTVYRVTLRRGQ